MKKVKIQLQDKYCFKRQNGEVSSFLQIVKRKDFAGYSGYDPTAGSNPNPDNVALMQELKAQCKGDEIVGYFRCTNEEYQNAKVSDSKELLVNMRYIASQDRYDCSTDAARQQALDSARDLETQIAISKAEQVAKIMATGVDADTALRLLDNAVMTRKGAYAENRGGSRRSAGITVPSRVEKPEVQSAGDLN